MSNKTYSAHDVARYFLAMTDPESNDVSNMKLQKLCYYAQGIVSAMRGSPLFSERIEAWDHGPVVPSLYQEYRNNGSSPIPVMQDFDGPMLDDSDKKALKDIYDYYAQFSAWRLRNMTHDERPWSDAYQRVDREIKFDELVSYFRPMIEDDYVMKVYGSEIVHQTA